MGRKGGPGRSELLSTYPFLLMLRCSDLILAEYSCILAGFKLKPGGHLAREAVLCAAVVVTDEGASLAAQAEVASSSRRPKCSRERR